MIFTADELRTIMLMCDHERTLIDVSATMVANLDTRAAHATVAGLALKAHLAILAREPKPSTQEVPVGKQD